MPYEKNENEYGGGPKKADIIIKNTQNIAAKQDDLSEQTKLAVSRLDEAIELFNKNNQDSSYIVKQSEDVLAKLQDDNAALNQQLLYIAKQNETIYADLADKINELSEQAKTRENAMNGFADRINDVSEQTRKSEEAYSLIADKLAEISEQNKRSEKMYAELNERLAAVKAGSEVAVSPVVTERIVPAEVDLTAVLDKLNMVSDQLRRNERAYNELSDRVNDRVDRPTERTIIREKAEPADMEDFREVLDKLARLSEQLRRNDNAHSMLADKFEILSMRVEQYALESTKNPSSYQQPQVAPIVMSAPAPAQAATAEIDYDKLAQKIASLISTETVSPDYIASKVAEQIIIPDGTPNVNVTVDADYIAGKVVDRINLPEASGSIDGEELADKVAQRLSELNAGEIAASSAAFDEDEFADMLVSRLSEIKPDEEALAQRIAEKLDVVKPDEPASVQTLDLDEEELASRLAEKLGGIKTEENDSEPLQAVIDEEELAERIARKIGGYNLNAAPVSANVDLDEEELADAISLKVGSLKAEDFEILVDDEGCLSISKEIADNLDYNTISNILADKLREALDLAAAAQPDYEEMAERISEKITVAGINEDAIAEKAAAVLSNYMPEFDTEEITDKITGAVIDVVSAMPQPTLDSEEICNSISEKLIETQEGHDYDIVVDDDGISRITGLVSEEIENRTGVRFDKVEDDIAKLSEAVAKIGEYVDSLEVVEQNEQTDEYVKETVEDDYQTLSEVVATEIEKGVSVRLDSIEENIAKITELMSAEEEVVEEIEEEYDEDDYARLSEVVAAEIEKGVSVQLNSVADNIAKITEYLAEEENEEEDEAELAEVEPEEAIEEEEAEEDYTVLSEAVASEVEKRVAYRLDTLEEGLARLTEIITAEEEPEEAEEVYSEDEAVEEEEVEVDYTALSEVVAAEIEKGVSARLDSIEEKISGIADIITSEEELAEEEYDEETEEEAVEEDYTVLSEAVADEVEKRVSTRLEALEENVSKITEIITAEAEEEYDEETEEEEYEEDYSVLSEAVADEVEKRVSTRLETLEENVNKITEIITAEAEEEPEEVAESEETEEEDYTELSEAVANEVEKRVSIRLDSVEESISNTNTRLDGVEDSIANTNARFDSVDENLAKLSELVQEGTKADATAETVASTLPVIVAAEIEKGVKDRLDSIEENIAKITELVTTEEELAEYEEYEVLDEDDDYAGRISEVVANEVGSRISDRLVALEENVNKITEIITAADEEEPVEEAEAEEEDYTELSEAVANELENRISDRLVALEENVYKLTEIITAEPEEVEEPVEEAEEDYTHLSEAVADEVEKRVSGRLESVEESIANTNTRLDSVEDSIANTNARFDSVDDNLAKLTEIITAEPEEVEEEPVEEAEEKDYTELSEAVANEVERRVIDRLTVLEDSVNKLTEIITLEPEEVEEGPYEETEEDYTVLSEAVANEVEKRVADRLAALEENVNKLTEVISAETRAVAAQYAEELSDEEYIALSETVASEVEKRVSTRLETLEENVSKITEIITAADEEVAREEADKSERAATDYTGLSEAVASEVEKRVSTRLNSVEENIASTNARFDRFEEHIAKISELVENSNAEDDEDNTINDVKDEVREIRELLASGVLVAAATETAAAQSAEALEEEQELVTVSDLVEAPAEEDDEEAEEDDGEDFLIDVLDMDAFSDDELMPGELSEYSDGVDFANMMKFKRSFISRIIQSSDDNKQFYGEVKHALLSYRRVNSNVAWGAERFNKGRETIARLKIRGKTLCLYLALDPNSYKVSVYHHVDVSDNKSVAGTPMMVKVKSPLGVRKAIRLIDEMLALRNGEKREIPERDYAAMYPYETIEELIEDGLVKDVRKDK